MHTFRAPADGGTPYDFTGANWPAVSIPDPPSGDDEIETTVWAYDDGTGLVTSKTDDSGEAVTYTYTNDGKLATRTWARASGSVVTTYDYYDDVNEDKTGELESVTYSDSTPDVSFFYDRLGRRTEVQENDVTVLSLAYDDAGSASKLQLTTETIERDGYEVELTRNYWTSGTQLGLSAGFDIDADGDQTPDYTTTHNYLATTGQLNRITGPGLPSPGVIYSRVANSDLIGTVYYRKTAANKVTITRGYESNRDLVAYATNEINGNPSTLVSQYDYRDVSGAGGYDALGRRTSVIYTGTAFSADHHADWGYNDRSELTTADRRTGTTPGAGNHTASPFAWDYDYDHIGNRLTLDLDDNATPTTYTANDLNQYTETDEPSETFGYDEDGNMTIDATYAYLWDAENRLIAVTTRLELGAEADEYDEGDESLEFGYDYQGRRVRKTHSLYTSGAWQLQSEQRFIYDGWNVVMVLDDNDDILRKYTWGLDLSGSIHGAGGIGGLLACLEVNDAQTSNDDEYFWFTYDANGNVAQVLEYDTTTQTVSTTPAAHYEYDPYGNPINDISSQAYGPDNPFRFSTKWHDTELPDNVIVYFGRRYYVPRIGRWIRRDPLEEYGGWNLYAYVDNCPMGLCDALGMSSFAPFCKTCPCCVDACITEFGQQGLPIDVRYCMYNVCSDVCGGYGCKLNYTVEGHALFEPGVDLDPKCMKCGDTVPHAIEDQFNKMADLFAVCDDLCYGATLWLESCAIGQNLELMRAWGLVCPDKRIRRVCGCLGPYRFDKRLGGGVDPDSGRCVGGWKCISVNQD